MKFIKKLSILFLMLLFGFISCKKETKQLEKIIGKWSVRSYVITNFENSGKEVDDTKDIKPRPTFEFDGKQKFIYTLFNNSPQTISYSVNGDKVIFSEEIAFDHKEFNFLINNSTLTLKSTISYKVGNLSYSENTTITLDKI